MLQQGRLGGTIVAGDADLSAEVVDCLEMTYLIVIFNTQLRELLFGDITCLGREAASTQGRQGEQSRIIPVAN